MHQGCGYSGVQDFELGGAENVARQERDNIVESLRQEVGLSLATRIPPTVINLYCTGQRRGIVLWRFLLADSGAKPIKTDADTRGFW